MINDPITLNHPDFQILKRVKTSFEERDSAEEKQFMAAIIDLETLGLDARQHDIIELGLLAFSFSSEGILSIVDSYNELNDPGKPIPQEITAVTGIRDEDVRGKHIDWAYIGQLLHKTHLIICHNSSFDRNFLELQTPHTIQPLSISASVGT